MPHKQPPAVALFLLLPLNVLAPAAGVTVGTEVVSAVSQRVSETEALPGAGEAESLLRSQRADPTRNGLVGPWKQHSLTASGRSRVNSELNTYL